MEGEERTTDSQRQLRSFDLSRSIRPGGVASFSDGGLPGPSPEKQKQVRKKPMMLLSRSKGVQTEFTDAGTSPTTTTTTTTCLGDGSTSPFGGSGQPMVESPNSENIKHGSRALSPTPSSSTRSNLDPSSESRPPLRGDLTSYDLKSDTSSIHENRTGSLPTLISHMNLLLNRLSQSDVPTLTKRLKRQHLPGIDVGHLSQSTINAILAEVNELRTHFRSVLDTERKLEAMATQLSDKDRLESLVTRKDFLALVKLFKEVFAELSQLRGTINEVILDPATAVKLRDAILREEEEEEARGRPRPKPTQRQSSGLGWIAAPISKFFVTPPVETTEDNESSANDIASGRNLPGRGSRVEEATIVGVVGVRIERDFFIQLGRRPNWLQRRARPRRRSMSSLRVEEPFDEPFRPWRQRL